jgi:PAS domain S-box-containing protein
LRVSLSETGVSILGARVFIIDDRSVNRKILTKFASSVGDDIMVSAFPNPVDALVACARTVPDLVITDFKMPLMDGAGFIRNLRGQVSTADVPVIVVTAYEDHEIRREALEAGATDFILSPVDPWEFQTRARNLLRLRAQQMVIHRQTVRESEERFRLLVEGVRDYAIVMLDPAGLVTSWNAGAARLLGYSEEEILGQPARLLDPEERMGDGAGDGSSGVAAMLKAASSDGSVHAEHVRVRKDGTRFHADILVTSMRNDAGRLSGFSMVTHDITARREMEGALRDALAESQVLLRELHHRVRNNLQVISTVLYLQMLGMPDGELKQGFRRTQQRIDGLGLLFRNLLGPSRITSVRFDAYLVDLCTNLVSGFDAGRQLRRSVDIGALALELDMAGPLGLVIGEILFTASDSASPAADGADGDSGLTVCICSDASAPDGSAPPDGSGLVLNFEFNRHPQAGALQIGGHSSLGATVISALVNQLNARLSHREDGGQVRISLALPRTLFEFA